MQNQIVFTKTGIIELHAAMHERLDLLLRHIETVPEGLHHKPIPGFGPPSIWKQLVHILTCEEGWVHDLQNQPFAGWLEEERPTIAALRTAKARIREATRTYLSDLDEAQLNKTLQQRPSGLGRRTPESCLYPVARHNSRISSQRAGSRHVTHDRISSARHRSAAGIDAC